MSLCGLLRNFGLKVVAISRGRYEHRICELRDGNPMLETATGPMLRARALLRLELARFWSDASAKWLKMIPSVVG